MTPSRARAVLHALPRTDPQTGVELPGHALTLRSDICKELYLAVAAFDLAAKRARRRAELPESSGAPWTTEEEQRLATEYAEGLKVAAIAEVHGRTVRAIEARLERMGLITAAQRATRPTLGSQSGPVGGDES